MSICSSSVSVNFIVETFDCASTTRQQRPLEEIALDASASGVQIVDDIDQPANILNEIYWFVA
jgi:hypothetical protein